MNVMLREVRVKKCITLCPSGGAPHITVAGAHSYALMCPDIDFTVDPVLTFSNDRLLLCFDLPITPNVPKSFEIVPSICFLDLESPVSNEQIAKATSAARLDAINAAVEGAAASARGSTVGLPDRDYCCISGVLRSGDLCSGSMTAVLCIFEAIDMTGQVEQRGCSL